MYVYTEYTEDKVLLGILGKEKIPIISISNVTLYSSNNLFVARWGIVHLENRII